MRRFRRSTCPRSPRWRREKPALSRRPRPSCLAVGVDCPRANCSPALRIKTRVPDAARVLPDLATGVSREEVLSATLRAWGRRAPSGIAREAGTAVRTGFAGHREHLPRRVHWSFTLGKQLTNHSPARRGSIFSSAARATTIFFSIQPPRHTPDAQRSGETQHARVGFEHTRRAQRRKVDSTFHEPREVAREARLPELEGEESGHQATSGVSK